MRSIAVIALLFLFVPTTTSCINLDLDNGEANAVFSQIDANGAGFGKKNINFNQIITIDPLTDEQLVGGFAVDALGGEIFQIELSYLREDMIRLEEQINGGFGDPRGQDEADVRLFQVADNRLQPFVVQMFVTFARKEQITDDNGRIRNIKTIQTVPAFCNFIDPVNEVTGCFEFNDNVTEGIENTLGSVGGLNGETTISATFSDLIVVDSALFEEELELLRETNGEEGNLANSILVRLAPDPANPGEVFIFNNNLAIEIE